MIKPTANKG